MIVEKYRGTCMAQQSIDDKIDKIDLKIYQFNFKNFESYNE